MRHKNTKAAQAKKIASIKARAADPISHAEKENETVLEMIAPMARFLGHTIASGLGFACYSMIEIALKHLIDFIFSFGDASEVVWLQKIDNALFFSGILIFGVSFVLGLIRFIKTELRLTFGK